MTVWIILLCYIAIMAVVGIITSRKVSGLTSFVVGGRKAGAWMSAFAYGTTYFSAVLFIGYAGRSGWEYGLWAVLIGVGNALIGSYLAWKVLANRTREVTRRLKIKTMPQLFEQRYHSKPMKLYAAVVIFIFMVPYSASVYSGLSYLCTEVLKIDYNIAMLAIAVIAAVYLVLGGYLASLTADFIQGIVMIVGIIAMIICVFATPQVGGATNGLSTLIEKMELADIAAPNTELMIGLGGLILLTSFGSWGMPQMIHKFYGIADKPAVKRGTVISTLFALIISCGAYLAGALSRLFFSDVPMLNGVKNYDLIIPQILTNLPTFLLGVILVLVLSASVSTLSGITLTSCSSVSMDLVAGALRPNMDKGRTLTLTRVLCVLFIACSYLIAMLKTPILMLMSFSWGSIAGSFIAPYLLGLYWKRMNRAGAWSGMIGGLAVSLLLTVVSGFNAGLAPVFGIIAVVVSFACSVVGTLATSRKGTQSAPEFFEVFQQEEQAEMPQL